jgi:hypothetical protein
LLKVHLLRNLFQSKIKKCQETKNMPLPLIPLVLGGAALLAGSYGAKKGYDAKSDYSEANSKNERAQDLVDTSKNTLEASREAAQKSLESLGLKKAELYEDALIPFVETYSQIKNVNFRDENLANAGALPEVTQEELAKMEDSVLEIASVLKGGSASLGAGGIAGMATYGGVGLVGKASTGTAIGALSGAAAKNATLAWLGGGALSTGGLGVAGGTMVLGGLVAGPVLAVGGMMLASKAKESLENARSNLAQAKVAAEEMQAASVAADGIKRRLDQVNDVTRKLGEHLVKQTLAMKEVVSVNTDFATYSEQDQATVYLAAATAKTLKTIMETPVIDQDGDLTNQSKTAISHAKKAIKSL